MRLTIQAFLLGFSVLGLATPGYAGTLNYTFTIIEPTGFTNGSSGEASDYAINNLGTAARKIAIPGTFSPRTDPTAFVETVDIAGQRASTFLNQDGRAFAFSRTEINDAGQVLTNRNRGPVGEPTNGVDELVRVERDGSSTVLGQVGVGPLATHPNQFRSLGVGRASMNNIGEVVAIVETLSGERQIVKFSQDGQSFEVITDERSGPSLSNSQRVVINDSGQVAFQSGGIYIADNNGIRLEASSLSFPGNFNEFSLNNDGDLLITGPDSDGGVGSGVFIHRAGTSVDEFEFVNEDNRSIPAAFGAPNLNNFGQAAYTQGSGVFVDQQLLLAAGDSLAGQITGQSEGLPSPVARASIRENVNFNDLGQAIIDIRAQDGQRTLVRADPVGATFENAIRPDEIVDGVASVSFELVNALGVDNRSPIFVDPVFGDGLSYSITNGGPNFMSLVVPDQDLGGLNVFDVVFGGFTQTVGFGETIDFSSLVSGGVSSFDIFGTGGASSFIGDFVAGFTFASQGTVAFDITPTSPFVAPVPLPASLWLSLAAFGGLWSSKRRSSLKA